MLLVSMFAFTFSGWICLLVGIWRSHVLSRMMTWTVVVATVAPWATGQWSEVWMGSYFQYFLLLMLVLFNWPIAYRMWVDSTKRVVAGRTAQA